MSSLRSILPYIFICEHEVEHLDALPMNVELDQLANVKNLGNFWVQSSDILDIVRNVTKLFVPPVYPVSVARKVTFQKMKIFLGSLKFIDAGTYPNLGVR